MNRTSGRDKSNNDWWNVGLVAILAIVLGFAWYSNWPDNWSRDGTVASRPASRVAAPTTGAAGNAR